MEWENGGDDLWLTMLNESNSIFGKTDMNTKLLLLVSYTLRVYMSIMDRLCGLVIRVSGS
jgi:hypothetical protein